MTAALATAPPDAARGWRSFATENAAAFNTDQLAKENLNLFASCGGRSAICTLEFVLFLF
jgi:hypothetical protein